MDVDSGPADATLTTGVTSSSEFDGDPSSSHHDRHDPHGTRRVIQALFGRDTIYIALWLVQLVLAALLTPAVSRLLGPERYGEAVAAFAVMQVLFPIAGLSLGPAIQRSFAGPDGELHARKLIGFSVIVATTVTTIAMVTGPLWAPVLGFKSFVPSVQYAVLWAGLCGISYAGLGLLKSQDRLAGFAGVTLTQSLAAEALALALVIFYQHSAGAYLLGQAVCQAIAVLLVVILTRPKFPRLQDIPLVRDAARFSISLVPAALAIFVFDASDRLIIQANGGSAEVGRYAIARNIGGLAVLLIGTMNMVWMPRIFELSSTELRRSVLATTRDATVRLMLALVLAIVMASPLILRIMAPPSYHADGLLLVLALIAAAAIPCAGAQSGIRILLLSGRTTAIAVCTVTAALLNLGVNLVVVPIWGINGAALVSFCAYTVQMLALTTSARRYIKLPRPPLRLMVVTGLVMAFCLASTQVHSSVPVAMLRAILAIAAAGYFATELSRLVGTPLSRDQLRLRGRGGRPTAGADEALHENV